MYDGSAVAVGTSVTFSLDMEAAVNGGVLTIAGTFAPTSNAASLFVGEAAFLDLGSAMGFNPTLSVSTTVNGTTMINNNASVTLNAPFVCNGNLTFGLTSAIGGTGTLQSTHLQLPEGTATAIVINVVSKLPDITVNNQTTLTFGAALVAADVNVAEGAVLFLYGSGALYTVKSFNNAGVTNWMLGQINIQSNGGGVFTNQGVLNIASTNAVLTSATTTVNTGTINVNAATSIMQTFVNQGLIVLNNNMVINTTSGNDFVNSGNLAGPGSLTTNQTFNWTSGNIMNGQVMVQGNMFISELNNKMLFANLYVKHNIYQSGSFWLTNQSSSLVVAPTATWSGAEYAAIYSAVPNSFINNGTVSGSLNLTNIQFINNVFLGTVDYPLINLNIYDANFTASSTSNIIVGLSSLSYSPITVVRTFNNMTAVNLAGSLKIVLLEGFNPNNGDNITVIQTRGTVVVYNTFSDIEIIARNQSNLNACSYNHTTDLSTGEVVVSFTGCTEPATPPSPSSSNKWLYIIIGIVVGVVVLLIIIIAIVMYRRRQHAVTAEKQRLI